MTSVLRHKLFLELDAFDIQHKGGRLSITEDWTETVGRSRINRQAELLYKPNGSTKKVSAKKCRTKCIPCATWQL